MEEKLITSLAEALEMTADQIKIDDKFRNYEHYSSLTELSILALLDSDFGIEMEMREFNNFKTVGDLVKVVSKKQ